MSIALQRFIWIVTSGTIAIIAVLFAASVSAATPYGALYEAGELVSDTGIPNRESIVMRHPNEDTWIAITTNSGGAQWFRSDEYALNWEQIDTPAALASLDCSMPGRHSIRVFQDSVYFGYHGCANGSAYILRLEEGDGTGASDATVVLDGEAAYDAGNLSILPEGFPTATVLDEALYFFTKGMAIRSTDGESWEEVAVTNWPDASPLEATEETESESGEAVIYLPFENGEVYEFNGSTLTLIGEAFLGESNVTNLPSIGIFRSKVYVGNHNVNGAKLMKWDGSGTTTWSDVVDYAAEDANNVIINKMLHSQRFSGDRYLIFFTANHATGVEVASVDSDGNYLQLIDDGLGGDDPENNAEVLSAIRQETAGTTENQPVIIFSTQADDTSVSETKIFILQLSTTFATNPALNYFNQDVLFGSTGRSMLSRTLKKQLVGELEEGEELTVQLPKQKVKPAYEYILYVDGEEVDSTIAKKGKKVALTYEEAAELEAGDTFTIRIGTRPAYGPAGDKVYSTKIIKGNKRKIKVVES